MTGLESYIEQEREIANRYRWWGVYLVRERRRLQAITEAVSNTESDETTTVTRRPDAAEPSDTVKGRAALLNAQQEEY